MRGRGEGVGVGEGDVWATLGFFLIVTSGDGKRAFLFCALEERGSNTTLGLTNCLGDEDLGVGNEGGGLATGVLGLDGLRTAVWMDCWVRGALPLICWLCDWISVCWFAAVAVTVNCGVTLTWGDTLTLTKKILPYKKCHHNKINNKFYI